MLQNELCKLQKKLSLDPSQENVTEFYNLKFKLNKLSLLKTKGGGGWCGVELADANRVSATPNAFIAWKGEIIVLNT